MRPWESSTAEVVCAQLEADCACAGQQVSDDVNASLEHTHPEGDREII